MRHAWAVAALLVACGDDKPDRTCSLESEDHCICDVNFSAFTEVDACTTQLVGGGGCCESTEFDWCFCAAPVECVRFASDSCHCGPGGAATGTPVAMCGDQNDTTCYLEYGSTGPDCFCGDNFIPGKEEFLVFSCTPSVAMCGGNQTPAASCE